MKTVELSEELYDQIMKRDKIGKPFEAIVWDLIEKEKSQKEMLTDVMQFMLATATSKSPEEMKKRLQEFEDQKRQEQIRRGHLEP